VPFLVLAVYQLAFFFSEHFPHHPLWQQHGAKAYQWLVQHKQQALLLNAQTEIMNGFTLLVTLVLPSRRPLLMLMVWQVLRLRYWSVDAAIHHRQVRRSLASEARWSSQGDCLLAEARHQTGIWQCFGVPGQHASMLATSISHGLHGWDAVGWLVGGCCQLVHRSQVISAACPAAI
jgi:hypothetical protein